MGIFGPIGDLISIIPNAFRTVDNITNAIANERIAVLNAKTEEERIHAEERLKALQSRQSLQEAESKVSNTNIWVRAVAASPVIVIVWKLMVWDKVIGSFVGCSQAPKGTCQIFTTDPLDDNQWKIIGVVYGFYFLYELTLSASKVFRRA